MNNVEVVNEIVCVNDNVYVCVNGYVDERMNE